MDISSGDAEGPPPPDGKCARLPAKSQEEKEDEEEENEARKRLAPRAKRERRQGGASATVCQVCSIRLNSGAQAQIHYKGKTHQRRLRRLAKVIGTGAVSHHQVHPLLGSPPLSGRASLQPHNRLEQFLPLRIGASSPLSLFPNFNAMDPVQRAVINHTFGIAPLKRRTTISCNICHLRFNSANQAEAHYKGHKHIRKLKAIENQRNRQKNKHNPSPAEKEKEKGPAGASGTPTGLNSDDRTDLGSVTPRPEKRHGRSPDPALSSPDTSANHSPQLSPPLPHSTREETPMEGCRTAPDSAAQPDPRGPPAGKEENKEVAAVEEKEAHKRLHCPTCKVTVNSSSQLEAHCSGSKHKQMLHSPNSSQSHRRAKRVSSPRLPCRIIKQRMGTNRAGAATGFTGQRFHCQLCQVAVNSESQLKQHMNSRRHKEHLAGKPVRVKAKITPYNKLQPSTALATKLALQKQLSKALPAGFLSSSLNPAALCTLASSPLALRFPQGPTAIIHNPLISPALFRPAPGPLRPTHPPIIFSPY